MSSPLRILFHQYSFSKTVTSGHSENLPTDLIKENKSLDHLSQEGNLEKTGQEKKKSNEVTHQVVTQQSNQNNI